MLNHVDLDDLNSSLRAFGMIGSLAKVKAEDFYRFRMEGSSTSSRSGWCYLYDNPVRAVFGDWRTDSHHSWRPNEGSVTQPPTKHEVFRQAIDEFIAQDRKERRYQQAKQKAVIRWVNAQPVLFQHAYLASKKVEPLGLRVEGGRLLLPICHNSQLVNIQTIYPDGIKRFQSGGQVKGCYSPIGELDPNGTLIICEGWATGATLHLSKQLPVACALNCGNLLAVAESFRMRFPSLSLIIAADDDRLTPSNPGLTKAQQVSAELGCQLIRPDWPSDAPKGLSDFNDLYCFLHPSPRGVPPIAVVTPSNDVSVAHPNFLKI